MPRTARPRPGFPDWWTTDDWSTPPDVIARLKREFTEGRPFDLDPCCRHTTRQADLYYSLEHGLDGLDLPWTGTTFVNPPYSDPAPWILKAITEARAGNIDQAILLLPADISTAWWRDLCPYAHQFVWPGRIKFLGYDGQPLGSPKSGSIVAIVTPKSADIGRLEDTADFVSMQVLR